MTRAVTMALRSDSTDAADPVPAVLLATRHPRHDTDHASYKEQASMIRRCILWRNNDAYDERLRRIVHAANDSCSPPGPRLPTGC